MVLEKHEVCQVKNEWNQNSYVAQSLSLLASSSSSEVIDCFSVFFLIHAFITKTSTKVKRKEQGLQQTEEQTDSAKKKKRKKKIAHQPFFPLETERLKQYQWDKKKEREKKENSHHGNKKTA